MRRRVDGVSSIHTWDRGGSVPFSAVFEGKRERKRNNAVPTTKPEFQGKKGTRNKNTIFFPPPDSKKKKRREMFFF